MRRERPEPDWPPDPDEDWTERELAAHADGAAADDWHNREQT